MKIWKAIRTAAARFFGIRQREQERESEKQQQDDAQNGAQSGERFPHRMRKRPSQRTQGGRKRAKKNFRQRSDKARRTSER